TIARMAEHWQMLLAGIVEHCDQPVADLPLLTAAEREQLALWNSTALDYDSQRCLHELFAEQAKQTPDAIALTAFGDGSSASAQLTYAELDRRADAIARYLRTIGVGPDVPVGLYMERTEALVAAILGVLKAGGCYVPLDPAYPTERLQFVLEDTRMPVLLTQESLISTWPDLLAQPASTDSQPQVIYLDRDSDLIAQAAADLPDSGVVADNLAYVIYTSGSTGRPKGVAISHRSATALLAWAETVFSADELSGVLAATSICFDLSIFELFTPLTSGGSVILVDNILRLSALPASANITLINTVPSALTELLRIGALPASAETINLAGEPLTLRLAQQIYREPTVKRLYNLYGPSEDTTYSTGALIERGDGEPTIGRPIANTQAYVLDSRMQPVPIGVVGELYLGGDGLARGYLNRPDLTASRFVPDAFGQSPGQRLYRTGDLVRFLPDGNIAFLGRIDHQVKLRGFRIELGEIEAVLAQHPMVQDCTVIVHSDEQSHTLLVAYVVENQEPRTKNQEDSTDPGFRTPVGHPVLGSELRQYVGSRLPEYMVPSMFVVLDALPLTPSGKLDRRALPLPDRSRRDLDGEVVLPRTPLEATLASIWAELLGIEQIGIHDNFFALGGHSLLVTQMVARLRETLELELPVHSLFETPTIASLARQIETLRWAVQAPPLRSDDLSEDIEEGVL
ncbi:MAG TPA: amino acid adenylation domain-containing protein, partial [Herpetosiphonaceae bacterium]